MSSSCSRYPFTPSAFSFMFHCIDLFVISCRARFFQKPTSGWLRRRYSTERKCLAKVLDNRPMLRWRPFASDKSAHVATAYVRRISSPCKGPIENASVWIGKAAHVPWSLVTTDQKLMRCEDSTIVKSVMIYPVGWAVVLATLPVIKPDDAHIMQC